MSQPCVFKESTRLNLSNQTSIDDIIVLSKTWICIIIKIELQYSIMNNKF